jgi:hypothetical protein
VVGRGAVPAMAGKINYFFCGGKSILDDRKSAQWKNKVGRDLNEKSGGKKGFGS